ncbi:uncharacterized protein WCC33_008016 [Rhinophrynus dorsalis]
MGTPRQPRRVRLAEARASWEDQGGSEMAAGKMEVMEKFFTPLPHPSVHRSSKGRRKETSSWDGVREPYYTESSSSSSSSSSTWSSESNFGGQTGFTGYHSNTPHSRSCNDLSVVKGRRNDDEKRSISSGKQKEALGLRRSDRGSTDRLSVDIRSAGSTKLKGNTGHAKGVEPIKRHGRGDKRVLKDGCRRARSVEVLAEKETKKEKGKDKRKFVEEKQRFSRFLDEITVQVLSPSNLNYLGVKETQAMGTQETWKNSSTDSSGSRGKRYQDTSAVEHQELRKKGKGKMEATTRSKLGANPPGSRRSRDQSTSPESAASSTGNRKRVDSSATVGNHSSRRFDSHGQREQLQGRGMSKGGSQTEQVGREKKEDHARSARILKGKTLCVDKPQSSELSDEPTTPVPIIPPPDWWRDMGDSVTSHSQSSEKNMENSTDRRMKAAFSGAHLTDRLQENNLHASTSNLETDKDSLNQKITQLLEHLVRAQSTICALEKLNVSSLLSHFSPDNLESAKLSHQSSVALHQVEGQQDLKTSTGISSEACRLDTTEKEMLAIPIESHPTAFSPWSPTRQRSFPAIHSLYNSTESECSLEETLPKCKLLSPRFPNLGESFSDDRMDGVNSDDGEDRSEQKTAGSIKSTLQLSNLLPAHRFPLRSLRARASSSESSGDDPLLNWGQSPSNTPVFDYLSAQKILDTLLGLTSPSPTPQLGNIGSFSTDDATQIDEHPTLVNHQTSNHTKHTDIVPRADSKHVSNAVQNKDALKLSGRNPHTDRSSTRSPNPLHQPKELINCRFPPGDSKIPPIPSKRSLPARGLASKFSTPSPVEDTNFCPLGTQEGPSHHKSEYLQPPESACIPVYSPDHLSRHSVAPFARQSPSGGEQHMRGWDNHGSSQKFWQEGKTEKRNRKEKTVHFHTLSSESHTSDGQVTLKSKFMSSRVGAQVLGDSTSVDSTLL